MPTEGSPCRRRLGQTPLTLGGDGTGQHTGVYPRIITDQTHISDNIGSVPGSTLLNPNGAIEARVGGQEDSKTDFETVTAPAAPGVNRAPARRVHTAARSFLD